MTAPVPRLRAFAGSLREASCNRRLIPLLADERLRAGVHGVGAAVVRLAAAQALARVLVPTEVSA